MLIANNEIPVFRCIHIATFVDQALFEVLKFVGGIF